MFTSEELRSLAARASTIDERLAGGFTVEDTPRSRAAAEQRLQKWCLLTARGDEELFRKRLARDGLKLESVKPLLGIVHLPPDHSTPDWVETLRRAVAAMNGSVSSVRKYNPIEADNPLPFEQLLLPLVEDASRELEARLSGKVPACLEDAARVALDRYLLKRLTGLLAPALLDGFSIFRVLRATVTVGPESGAERKIYNEYVAYLRDEGLCAFFLDYPVLGRLLATLLQQWLSTTAELVERLDDDRTRIREVFTPDADPGPAQHIELGLSDSHNHGRQVAVLTFGSGMKLVYKPRSVGIDLSWHRLIHWLNNHGAPVSLAAPATLERPTYGWIEYVTRAPCRDYGEAQTFYRRAGALLCLVLALQGTDCHLENIIASGAYPVLIDLETLLHPHPSKDAAAEVSPENVAAVQRLQSSVLATGFLPNWVVLPGDRIEEIGGLSYEKWRSRTRPRIEGINTDGMRLTLSVEPFPSTHLPNLNGMSLAISEFCDEVVSGFEAMYRFLWCERESLLSTAGPLTPFSGQTIRAVLRPTWLYTVILQKSTELKFLGDGVEWSLHFDFLARATDWLFEDSPLWPIQGSERAALARLDIPKFVTRTDTDGLELSDQTSIEGCFEGPSHGQMCERLERFCEEDLGAQIRMIHFAVETTLDHAAGARDATQPAVPPGPISTEPYAASRNIDEAIAIAEKLRQEGLRSPAGAAWIGAMPLPGEERCQLVQIGCDLLCGTSGIALFLAALESVTKGGGYRELALAALSSVRRQLAGAEEGRRLTRALGIGGARGLGSVIYALTRTGEFLNEESLIEDAGCAAMLLTEENIATDRSFDIVAGAAGAILGLLALFQAGGKRAVLEKAIACGRHLLHHKQSDGDKAWKTVGPNASTGFAHGAAGISYALLRLYELTSDQRFLDAARDGIAYERSSYSARARNWPDVKDTDGHQSETRYLCQWCHGAAGIGLARIGGLSLLDDPDVRAEIDAALLTTQEWAAPSLDHLCCGSFGRIEFLFTAGRKIGRPDLITLARSQAAQLTAHAREAGGYRFMAGTDSQNPGFFFGISGIGYELLRLSHAEKLPSVLLWE